MSRYFHNETQTDPECMTVAGEKRLDEILAHMSADVSNIHVTIESRAEELAHVYATKPYLINETIQRFLNEDLKEDAMIQLREEDV